jgi:hypothetical protein
MSGVGTRFVIECSFAGCKKRLLAEENAQFAESAQKMRRCGGCRTNYYCTAQCQKLDRKTHRALCVIDKTGQKTCVRLQDIFCKLIHDDVLKKLFLKKRTFLSVSHRIAFYYVSNFSIDVYSDSTLSGALSYAFLTSLEKFDFFGNYDGNDTVFIGPLFQVFLFPVESRENILRIDFNSTFFGDESRSCASGGLEIPLRK